MAEILLVEDDMRLRSEIEKFLESKGHDVALALDGEEAWSSIQQMAFDVIVMDIKLPGKSGTEVLKAVAEQLPCRPPIILITGHGDKETAIQALKYGAFDFLEKPFAPPLLEKAIEKAMSEKRQDILNYRVLKSNETQGELTVREREVAVLAGEGLSNEEIANRLQLGSETVKTHLKKIFRKLGVSNRTTLSAKMHEWGQEIQEKKRRAK